MLTSKNRDGELWTVGISACIKQMSNRWQKLAYVVITEDNIDRAKCAEICKYKKNE